jgi:hypothetical protein
MWAKGGKQSRLLKPLAISDLIPHFVSRFKEMEYELMD